MAGISKRVVMAEDAYGFNNDTAADNATLISTETSINLTEDLRRIMDPDGAFVDMLRMAEISNIVVPIVTILILVFGLIGNALVIYITLVTDRQANHPIHSMFVLNLAVADIIFLCVSGPYWVTINASSAWRFGSFLCPVIPFLSVTSMASSIFTICALAWMRFMALTMPFRFSRSRISTRKAGYIVLFAIWIAGIALSTPNLVYFRLVDFVILGHKTTECQWQGDKSSLGFSWALTLFTYVLPSIIVSIFYIIIGREVLCFMRNYGDGNQRLRNGPRTEEEQERFKSTLVVLSLIIAFLICWFPHFLNNMFKYFSFWSSERDAKSIYLLDVVSKTMGYAHACVNPFVYTFASPAFRRGLRRSVQQSCEGCKKQHDCKIRFSFRNLRRNQQPGSPFALKSKRSASPRKSPKNNGRLVTMTVSNRPSGATGVQTEQVPMTTVFGGASQHADGNLSVTNEINGNKISRLSAHREEDSDEIHALLSETEGILDGAASLSSDNIT